MTGTESSASAIQAHAPAAILEVAVLDVRGTHAQAFEAALSEAMPLIQRQPGCLDAAVRPCLEKPGRYLLLVNWADVAAHEQGFRRSADYQRWRALLHGFYEPFPLVEHYGPPL